MTGEEHRESALLYLEAAKDPVLSANGATSYATIAQTHALLALGGSSGDTAGQHPVETRMTIDLPEEAGKIGPLNDYWVKQLQDHWVIIHNILFDLKIGLSSESLLKEIQIEISKNHPSLLNITRHTLNRFLVHLCSKGDIKKEIKAYGGTYYYHPECLESGSE